MGIRSLSLKTGDATRHSARAWHHPNILRIRKSDLRGTHGRGAQQTGAAIRSLCVRCHENVRPGEPDAQKAHSKNRDGQNERAAAEPRLQGAMRHSVFLQKEPDGFALLLVTRSKVERKADDVEL